MKQTFIPIQFDKSHLSTIGERLYSQSLDLIRELVANAYDADATTVKIIIGNGQIIVEDNGLGMDKTGLRQYFTIGSSFKRENPTSSKFGRIRIGEFGIGKFAVLSICDRFEIYTSSGLYCATLIFDRNDFEKREDWNIPLIEHQGKNGETGTKISLSEVKKSVLIGDVERHIINIFPLTDPNFSIFVNDIKLQPRYISGERFKIKEQTEYGDLWGEVIISSLMLPKEMEGIGIRVKGVLIKRDTFDIEKLHAVSARRLTGEINAPFLPITASRDDLIKDTLQYQEFYRVMYKKLRRVIKLLEHQAASYKDRKAEKVLSDALITIREALKKNLDILILEGLPLFSKIKPTKSDDKIPSQVVSTALSGSRNSKKDGFLIEGSLKEDLNKVKPKLRSRIKTLLRDSHRIVKKVKIGGSEFLVSFAHLGEEEKESFMEGGIIFINRDHQLFKKIDGKEELVFYHLIRLVTQEIVKLSQPKDLDVAFDWQGKLMKDAYLLLGKK